MGVSALWEGGYMSRIYSPQDHEATLIARLLKIEPNVTIPPIDRQQDYFARGTVTDGCGHIHTKIEADVSTYGLPPRFHRKS